MSVSSANARSSSATGMATAISTATTMVTITETGTPTAGAADLIVDVMTKDGVTESFSHTIDTGIDIQTSGLVEKISWGHGITAAIESSGTKGTISTTPGVVSNVDYMRLNLKASTGHDSTSCTGSVELWIEEP